MKEARGEKHEDTHHSEEKHEDTHHSGETRGHPSLRETRGHPSLSTNDTGLLL
ncbi:MAG: hypothetical protein ABW185_12415 [Sedimenticola sp.]